MSHEVRECVNFREMITCCPVLAGNFAGLNCLRYRGCMTDLNDECFRGKSLNVRECVNIMKDSFVVLLDD